MSTLPRADAQPPSTDSADFTRPASDADFPPVNLKMRRGWPNIVREYLTYCTYREPISQKSLRHYAGSVARFISWHPLRDQGPTAVCRQFVREDVIRHLRSRLDSPAPRTRGNLTPEAARNDLKALVHFSRWLHEVQKRSDAPCDGLGWSEVVSHRSAHSDATSGANLSATAQQIAIASPKKVGDMVERWYEMDGYSPMTAEHIRDATKRFLRWLREYRGSGPSEISVDHVTDWIHHLQQERLSPRGEYRSPNTVRKLFQSVHKLCEWLVVSDVLQADPTDGLRGPRGRRVFVPPLPSWAFQAAFEKCALGQTPMIRARNRFIVYFLGFTGARRSELMTLERSHIEGRTEVVITGKGAKQRIVGLHPKLIEATAEYLRLRLDERPEMVVTIHASKPSSVKLITGMFRELSQRVGHKISPHDLRRTVFTEMARRGTEWHVLQAIGGWASPSAAEGYIYTAARELGVAAQQEFDPTDPSTRAVGVAS